MSSVRGIMMSTRRSSRESLLQSLDEELVFYLYPQPSFDICPNF